MYALQQACTPNGQPLQARSISPSDPCIPLWLGYALYSLHIAGKCYDKRTPSLKYDSMLPKVRLTSDALRPLNAISLPKAAVRISVSELLILLQRLQH